MPHGLRCSAPFVNSLRRSSAGCGAGLKHGIRERVVPIFFFSRCFIDLDIDAFELAARSAALLLPVSILIIVNQYYIYVYILIGK